MTKTEENSTPSGKPPKPAKEAKPTDSKQAAPQTDSQRDAAGGPQAPSPYQKDTAKPHPTTSSSVSSREEAPQDARQTPSRDAAAAQHASPQSEAQSEGATAASEPGNIDDLKAERDNLRDRLMRALAEAENTRKRTEKHQREAQRYGATRFARDMLPVYDNLRRALDAADPTAGENIKAVIDGVELTLRGLLDAFARHGVQRLSPQLGDRFDPNLHEAMFEAPLLGTKAGTIIQISVEGFALHDRLLRPAQVGVSSASEQTNHQPPPKAEKSA
ncbi:MAG: nucleotide exchange factor GrpE [Rhodobacteraceae bacterium]|nr:nucleotide exchange factor GrpE [Paracoccaceae bacterium]